MNSAIALDMDGVLCDFETHWADCARRTLGLSSLEPCSPAYALHERYGISKAESRKVWDTFQQEAWWGSMPLYGHARELVYALEDLGCQVFVVTSIEARFHRARIESLCGLIPFGRVICVDPRNAPAEKAVALKNLGALAVLDDQAPNVNAAMSVVQLPVLLDRGYAGLDAPEHGVTVIDDPMDFAVLVETLLRRTRIAS